MSERRETWTVKRIAYPIREGDGRIHETFCYQVIGDDGKAVANAFTSAMADTLASLPDLVAALQAMLETHGMHGPCKSNSCSDCKYARDKATNALAKAGA